MIVGQGKISLLLLHGYKRLFSKKSCLGSLFHTLLFESLPARVKKEQDKVVNNFMQMGCVFQTGLVGFYFYKTMHLISSQRTIVVDFIA